MDFEFVFLSANPSLFRKAVVAGIDAVLVDWERKGKKQRQRFADTEVNAHTLEDLQMAKKENPNKLICRINPFSKSTKTELEAALQVGVDEILLPMVRGCSEVETVLKWVGCRAGVGILIETISAIKEAKQLGSLPLSRVFVGLNDLSIERKTPNIFLPLIDGTIEEIRPHIKAPFGFGGLTLPGNGFPVPCDLLVEEMIRMKCSFSFMRRSFLKDASGLDWSVEIPKMRLWIKEMAKRSLLNRNRFIQTVISL